MTTELQIKKKQINTPLGVAWVSSVDQAPFLEEELSFCEAL